MNRKLATDIDRALKGVVSGVELFDEIYDKVVTADNQTKKEKAELELKTQIKKLQRIRDQIKGWIASVEIREKEPLVAARKTIETRMETFKKAEKEAKTKAFSKEGLAQADKLDPEEQAKQECRDWVDEALHQIREQKDLVTADLEALQGKAKTKKNKEEIDEIQQKLKQHVFHVHNLEMVLRGLDNDALNYEDVEDLRDDVEYYVSHNSEPDFTHNESLYEPLDLEEALGALGKEVVGETAASAAAAAEETSRDRALRARKKLEADNAEEAAKADAADKKARADILLKQQQEAERQKLIMQREELIRKRREQLQRETAAEEGEGGAAAGPTTAAARLAATLHKTTEQLDGPAPETSFSAVVAAANKAHETASLQSATRLARSESAGKPAEEAEEAAAAGGAGPQGLIRPASEPPVFGGGRSALSPPTATPPGAETAAAAAAANASTTSSLPVSPVVPTPVMSPWPLMDASTRLALFDASLAFLPGPHDGERPKLYAPQRPFASKIASFPTNVAARFDSAQAYELLDVDALFFVFFHQPGTYAQFLAARQLKKLDWVYHRQHQVWMQRHEDPTTTTEDFEVGTFVYFDHVQWMHRVKPAFTFEYRAMETF